MSKENKLLTAFATFMLGHGIECVEDIYQNDTVDKDSLELIEDLFNIVDIHTKCDSRQTNADIIRNMSDEELGDLLQSVSSGVENGSPFISLCVDDNETTINFSDISEWLKSEAE